MSNPGPEPFRIRVVGDVHGHWSDDDARILERGDQDLVLFVGDLADEEPELIRGIAELDCEIAVMLGNHDAWQSFSEKRITPALRESLELLGEDHIAYDIRELPAAGVSLVGARPFSWGGRDLRSPEVYRQLYDVESMEASAERIAELASRAQCDDLLILAHNGPRGLGSKPGDIYGKDFGRRPGGDWGDRDLAWALRDIRATGKRVRAVVAGHMHDRLFTPRGAQRCRFVRRAATSFVNPAVVPRVRRHDEVRLHHFVELTVTAGELTSCDEVWIDAGGEVRERIAVDFVDFDAPVDAAPRPE